MEGIVFLGYLSPNHKHYARLLFRKTGCLATREGIKQTSLSPIKTVELEKHKRQKNNPPK